MLSTIACLPALAAGIVIISSCALAQWPVVGALCNFDAGNFERKDVHGMEIPIVGIVPADLIPS